MPGAREMLVLWKCVDVPFSVSYSVIVPFLPSFSLSVAHAVSYW